MPRLTYTKPRLNGAILAFNGIDPIEAFKRHLGKKAEEITTKVFLAPPNVPEITMLDPLGGYADGASRRRDRRGKQRRAAKGRS